MTINSGWLGRTPKLTPNGKPSGYFDYILNFEPVIPTPQNPDMGIPDTDNQQIRKNSIVNNTESDTNTYKTNTPTIPNNPISNNTNVGIGQIWLDTIKKLNINFDEHELRAISEDWAEHMCNIHRTLTYKQIEGGIQILNQRKNEG